MGCRLVANRGGAASTFVVVVLAISSCYTGSGVAKGDAGIDLTEGDPDGGATRAGDGGEDEAGPGDDGPPGGSGNGPASGNPGGDPSGDPDGDPSGDPGDDGVATTSGPGDDDAGSGADTADPPPPIVGGCDGYATRYWDCCKAHCGWEGNVPAGVTPLQSCDQDDAGQGGNHGAASSCNGATQSASYTCWSLAPWAAGDSLAYGFAAVPASGDICGRCYQLDFPGTSTVGDDPGSQALAGKTMIVQAINIGYDVGGGQFDLLIPGGGVGAFDACTSQWNVGTGELGPSYGGFLLQCKQDMGFGGTLQQYKDCVWQRCQSVFDEPGMADLQAGCAWFVDWFQVADNPHVAWQETECPGAITSVSGMMRDDVGDACG